jgi:hypothetical protein
LPANERGGKAWWGGDIAELDGGFGRMAQSASVGASPDAIIEIAKAIVGTSGDYSRTVAAGRAALNILRNGLSGERLHLNKKEFQWLDRIEPEFDALPADEWTLLEEMRETYSGLFDVRGYGLAAS